MANYYSTCRSNYFAVKDESKFLAFLDLYNVTPITEVTNEGVTYHGFLSEDENGLPTRFTENGTDEVMFTIDEEIAEHLAEDQVCVILDAGAEKQRYVGGNASAIHSSGERIDISLQDIYRLARDKFGDGVEITAAEY